MSSKAIVWIREDFRINLNPALSHACQNHNEVVALYIFNPKNFINKREAQLWWISKSLESYSKELSNFNINLEIQKGDEIEVLSKIKKKDNITLYWNKIYEPEIINLGKKIRDNILLKNEINFKYFKGNILNEFQNVTKKDQTPFKVFTPFWRHAERVYLEKIPVNYSDISKCSKKVSFFKNSISSVKIYPKKNWFKKTPCICKRCI